MNGELAFSFWFATLVAPAVEQWISRSLIGRHGGVISPFKDTSSEQNALQMVMQGVYVEINHSIVVPNTSKCIKNGGMTKDDIDMACMTEEMARAKSLVNISFKIKIPVSDYIEFKIVLSGGEHEVRVSNWEYIKERNSSDLKVNSQKKTFGTELGIIGLKQPLFERNKDSFSLEYSHEFLRDTITDKFYLDISLLRKQLSDTYINESFGMRIL